MMMKTYKVELITDGDDQILPLSDELLMEAGWNVGDTIKFSRNVDDSITMKKVEPEGEEEYYLVECVQQYRIRYMVKAKSASDAMDTVTMNEAKEFSQKDLGETIISARKIESKEEIVKMCDKDNDYVKSWSDESKMKAFVTEGIYEEIKGN